MFLEPGARVWAYTPPSLGFPNHPGHWEEITVGPIFNAEGGTANIHKKEPFPASRTLIKVFHLQLDATHAQDFFAKITTLTQRRLKLRDRLPVVAWPEALLFRDRINSAHALIGCTLPFVENARQLPDYTQDDEHFRAFLPNTRLEARLLVALNIIEAFELLHSREVLFGDPNPLNILINEQTHDVTLIDADSFDMTLVPPGGTRETFFPPPATAKGFRSPRTAILSGPSNKQVSDYGKADDNYVLAIHLFMLMVPGFTPWGGHDDAAEYAATQRRFAYGPTPTLPVDSHQMQLWNKIPQPVRHAFIETFVSGHPVTPMRWRALFKAHWGHLRGQLDRRRHPRPVLARTP
jgi:DNA-binding helix-hairpin-helix protein with protein kinase domain